jgi:hypothetical protein
VSAFGDEPCGLGLLPRRGVPVDRPARGGTVDRADELAVALRDFFSVAVRDGSLEAPGEGLDARAVTQVLKPLPGGTANALLLLPDVWHSVETPAPAGAAMVAEGQPGSEPPVWGATTPPPRL